MVTVTIYDDSYISRVDNNITNKTPITKNDYYDDRRYCGNNNNYNNNSTDNTYSSENDNNTIIIKIFNN